MIAVSDTTTAIYVPAPHPSSTSSTNRHDDREHRCWPPRRRPQATRLGAGDLVTWWTGDSVMVFDADNLTYKYTVSPVNGQAPVGPATLMAGKLLVPVTVGIRRVRPGHRRGERTSPVRRPPSQAPVIPGVAGTTLLEQRGDTLVALGSLTLRSVYGSGA